MPKIKVTNPRNVIDAHLKTNYFKLRNTGGPKGDRGDTGATGPQGPKGDTGNAATIYVGSTTTLQPGESATVENAGDKYHAVLNFGIPEGQKGDTGDAATIEVGTTTTSAPGSDASVTNSGDEHNAVLDFVIPRGSQGLQGVPGQAATIEVGTVTTLDSAQDATVVNSGTTSAAVFDFGIPKGDKGDTGSVSSEVVTELPVPGDDSKLYLMEKNPTVETADGAEFTIQNTATDGEMKLVELKGNATQNGTPTPDAPVAVNTTTGENVVKITWKNLFDKDMTPASTWHLTKETTQSGIELASTASGGVCYVYYEFPFKHSESVDATISFQKTGTGFVNIYFRDKNDNVTKSASNRTSTFSLSGIPSTTTRVQIYFYGDTSAVGRVTTYDNIQLELGSTATDYEPYQEQGYEVNLGKNLVNVVAENEITYSGYGNFTLSDGVITTTGNTLTGFKVKVQPNTQYTAQVYTTGTSGTKSLRIREYSAEPTDWTTGFVVQTQEGAKVNAKTSKAFTTSATTTWVLLCIYCDASGIEFKDIQLESGSSATSFAPYFTPIELAKIGNYQDRIYKDSGKWYIEKQTAHVNITNDTPWTMVGNRFYRSLPNQANPERTTTSAMSNCFGGGSYIDVYNGATSGYYIGLSDGNIAGTDRVYVSNPSATSASDFNTWLATHPFDVYYALATPTTTEITDSTLLAQLNFIANLYGGTNNIMLVGTGAQGEIAVEYQTWDKYNRYDVYIWNDQIGDYQILNSTLMAR